MPLKYTTIMQAEQKPDIYGGKNCDEHTSQWKVYCEGDKDSEYKTDPIIIDPKQFMPGTKITVEIPCCPKCELPCEICDCGFDWKAWAENEYC